jgi:hypothetical protein
MQGHHDSRSLDAAILASPSSMPRKALSIEELIGPDDPMLIPGVFNYCFRICERCPFTKRCGVFLEMEKEERTDPGRSALERVHDSFQQTYDLLHAWCDSHGIDFKQLQEESNSDEVEAELRKMDATRSDPLQKQAELYMRAAVRVTRALRGSADAWTWPGNVRNAIDTIGLEMIVLAAKVHRALSGFVCRDEQLEGNPIQSDWNGSAKVARLMIADSRAAWETLIEVGRASPDAPIRQLVRLLDQIDTALAERFPLAMDFVRPGFDEPAVAAGALTNRAPFELRPARPD